jgi:aryl-alcohol dehydrogenase-like predicted oxidoreductase
MGFRAAPLAGLFAGVGEQSARARQSTARGNSACATSTRPRSTAQAFRSSASAPRCATGRVTSSSETRCARYDVPLAAAALQFPLRHHAVASIVVGARSPQEVEADSELLALPVPEELWRSILA